jgi:hypothetical protein
MFFISLILRALKNVVSILQDSRSPMYSDSSDSCIDLLPQAVMGSLRPGSLLVKSLVGDNGVWLQKALTQMT